MILHVSWSSVGCFHFEGLEDICFGQVLQRGEYERERMEPVSRAGYIALLDMVLSCVRLIEFYDSSIDV